MTLNDFLSNSQFCQLSSIFKLFLQDSAELLALSRPEGPQLSLPGGFSRQTAPLSPCLLIHFHGGGFVAQTSKSHEVWLWPFYLTI